MVWAKTELASSPKVNILPINDCLSVTIGRKMFRPYVWNTTTCANTSVWIWGCLLRLFVWWKYVLIVVFVETQCIASPLYWRRHKWTSLHFVVGTVLSHPHKNSSFFIGFIIIDLRSRQRFRKIPSFLSSLMPGHRSNKLIHEWVSEC